MMEAISSSVRHLPGSFFEIQTHAFLSLASHDPSNLGILTLFLRREIGTGLTLLRDGPGSVAYYGAYEALKSLFTSESGSMSVSATLMAGGLAGIVGAQMLMQGLS